MLNKHDEEMKIHIDKTSLDQQRNPLVLASCSVLLQSQEHYGSSWQETDYPLKKGIKNFGIEQ